MDRHNAAIRLFLYGVLLTDAVRGVVMIAKRSSRVMALLLALPSTALALGLGSIQVKSHLDQPLDAQIAVLGATPGAMQSLSVGLASRSTFVRYGLTWPAYLNGTRIKSSTGPDGQVLLHLTSAQPVTDPILTLLVKASWARGVLYREYTILLNPPTYLPNATQPKHVAVAAPVVGTAARSGQLTQPSAPPAAAAPIAPPVVSTPRSGNVRVRPGDTLSGIASRFSQGGMNSARTRQWMVAIYQLNPRAFDHNMNVLRAGTVLQIPSSGTVAAVSRAAAWREVNHQDTAWHSAVAANASARLRLVAPQGGAGARQAGAAGASGALGALKSRVNTLQKELAHEKRLLQVKSAALARLQAQMARTGTRLAQPPAAVRPAAAATHPMAPAHPPVSRPAPAAAHTVPPGTFIQTLKRYWWALLALLVLLLAYGLARVLRARRESAADDRLSESSDQEFTPEPVPPPLERIGLAPRPEPAIDVRETTHEQPRMVMHEESAPLVAKHVPADQTMSSETALNLEQGDPLAEADFHMAYGLYDQAADLIRIAIQREPERRDLKHKLLEVFFVWGNKEQFVETAHELAETRDQTSASEWDKIVIMGRQLAPDDPLFATSAGVGAAAAQGVDLDLEGGQGRVDFDLMSGAIPAMAPGESGAAAGGAGGTGSFDLDIGAALGEDEAAAQGTGTDLNATLPGLETTSSETGITQEMNEYSGDHTGVYEPVEPTVEQPALNLGSQSALRQKVEALSQGSDRTAELAIDDLGLDLGTFETTLQPGLGADSPTMVAGLDEQSRELLAKTSGDATTAGDAAGTPGSTGTTSAWQIDERELENLLAEEPRAGAHDTAQTSRLSALESPDVDFDLGEPPKAKHRDGSGIGVGNGNGNGNGNGLDFDIGTATVPHADIGALNEMSEENGVSDLEPVTMSEVGTKLDLARAYMDMGDPDGARSILEEVMHEGSDAQRQEAGRLLESLPG